MKFCSFFLIFICFFHSAFCSKDTLETKIKAEILVQSERVGTERSHTLSKYKLNLKSLALNQINSLADAVKLLPGIYLRDYGGIGGIKLVSHRGLGAQDVAILIDGSKINNPQNGVLDLTLIPSAAFEEIEIIKGGSTTLFGNNSSSGFLNFSFNSFKKDNTIKFSIGEFKQVKLNTKLSYQIFKSFQSNFGFSFFKSDGNYPIYVNEFGNLKKVKRENNKIATYSFFLSNILETRAFFSKLNLLFTHSTRGVPGAVLQNYIENENAKLTDDFLFINLKFIPSELDKNFELTAKTLFTKTKYFDPQLNLLLLKKETAEYNNKDLELRIYYQKEILSFSMDLFVEGTYASFSGDMLENKVSKVIERKNFATGIKLFKTFNQTSFKYGFESNVRFDAISNFSPMYSISLGLLFNDTVSKLSSKLNFSTNYRLPTFNELYYLNYGNQNLRPEKTSAINFEIGFDIFQNIIPTINLFYYSTRNKIISVPKSPVQWSASNIAKTESLGFEFALLAKLQQFESIVSYSFTQAQDRTDISPSYGKQLIYTPKHIGNFVLTFPIISQISFSSKVSYVGERFSLPDNSQKSRLSPYILLDFNFSKKIDLNKFIIFVNLEILNVLDAKYDVILNYPMPGRYFLFSLTTNF